MLSRQYSLNTRQVFNKVVKGIGVQLKKKIFMQACRQVYRYSYMQLFKQSSNQVIKQSCVQVRRLGCMQVCRLAFLPARLHVVIHSSMQVYTQVSRCSGSPALPTIKKNIFQKENRKREKRKRKQSKRTGCRQAKRNRNKSRRVSCEERARHYAEVFLPDWNSPSYLRFLFVISFDKNINNNR